MKLLRLVAASITLLSGMTVALPNPNGDLLGSGDELADPRQEDEDSPLEANKERPHPIPRIAGPIPAIEVICTGTKLDRSDINTAMGKNVAYYDNHTMPGGSVRLFQWQTAMWGICNCGDKKVGCPQEEMIHADRLISQQCGDYYSGWVWSVKWKKQYVRDTSTLLGKDDTCRICPENCCKY